MHFTNRQLATLSSLINNEQEFTIVLKSLASRLNTTLDQASTFWETVQPLQNREYDADTFNRLLMNGEITDKIGEAILTRKSIRTRLNPDSVSPTIVTLPDDFIHPYFDRVLTVREMARMQSFDDSFEFLGKRTTGGDKRSQETPQFTQVGNAVPPLLARAIALKVREAIEANLFTLKYKKTSSKWHCTHKMRHKKTLLLNSGKLETGVFCYGQKSIFSRN